MKKSPFTHARKQPHKLSLRSETIRMLTEHELTLVAAGNCMNGSAVTQNNTVTLGIC